MSRVETVQAGGQRNLNLRNSRMDQKTGFGGSDPIKLSEDIEKKIAKAVEAKLDKRMGNWWKLSNMLAFNKGELQSQTINAIFTSSLAPIFIALNPFSHQDKKTKEYTAARQPISALIAISGGVAMTKAIDYYMNMMGSEGYSKFLDIRMNPDKGYLETKFNSEYGKAVNKQEFLTNYAPKDFGENVAKFNGTKPTRAYKKACLDGYVSKIQTARKALFTRLICEDPNTLKIDESTKIISVVKRDSKTGKEIIEKIGENIPNMGTQKELNEYVQSNSLHNVKLSQFLKEEFKFEFYKDGKYKPFTIDSKLSSINALEFFRKIGIAGDNTAVNGKSFNEPELIKILALIRQEGKTEGQMKNALAEIALKPGGEKLMANATGEQASRLIQMYMGEPASKAESSTLGQLFHAINLRGEKLQEIMDKNMVDALDVFAKYLKKHKLEGFSEKATLKDFAANLIKNKAGKMGSYFGNYKGYTGIFFNLFTTAITCTILNWAYPRIVAKVFPNLLKDDKAPKGGHK